MAIEGLGNGLKNLATLLTAITGLIGAWKSVQDALSSGVSGDSTLLPGVAAVQVGGLSILLIGIALGLQWGRLRQRLGLRSVLVDKQAVDIGRNYLEGRADDIEDVLANLADSSLVFLVGESGAGKSSLLRLGLLPKLEEDEKYLPLLVDSWGNDWKEGPREALSREVATKLDALLGEEARKELGLENGPFDSKRVVEILRFLKNHRGLVPVLLFDQFDDYQTRHRERFFIGQRRKVATHRQIESRNELWKEIGDGVRANDLRCLFVTRDDTSWGLECVRFSERPTTYLLQPLESSIASDLLRKITTNTKVGSVVAHPERGFNQLRERLIRDLAPEGWVLPIRMRVVFRGLAQLDVLTTAAYEREGGVEGLEALYIGRQVVAAARLAKVTPGDVRRLLLKLVDSKNMKTRPCHLEGLAAVARGGSGEPLGGKSLEIVLDYLEKVDVVRHRAEEGIGEEVWQLDHDYLCRGVVELERRSRRWEKLLEERHEAFKATRRPWARWRNLLDPWTQIRLVAQRLVGNLPSYGRYRDFAWLSTPRLVLNPAVLVLALSLYGLHLFHLERESNRLFTPFREDANELSSDEHEALWEITASSRSLRRAWLDRFFDRPKRFLGVDDRAAAILHSVAGLARSERDAVLKKLATRRCFEEPSLDARLGLCLWLIGSLEPAPEIRDFVVRHGLEHVEFGSAFMRTDKGLNRIFARLQASLDPSTIIFLVESADQWQSRFAVGSRALATPEWAALIEAQEAERLGRLIIARVEERLPATPAADSSSELKGWLGIQIRLFYDLFPRVQVSTQLELVHNLANAVDPSASLIMMYRPSRDFARRYPEQSRKLADQMAASIDWGLDPEPLAHQLAQVALFGPLSESSRVELLAALAQRLETETEPFETWRGFENLLAEALPPAKVDTFVNGLLDKLEAIEERNVEALEAAIERLTDLDRGLAARHHRRMLEVLLGKAEASRSEDSFTALVEGIEMLAPELEGQAAQSAFERLYALPRIKTDVWFDPHDLNEVLQKLARRLQSDNAEALLPALLENLLDPTAKSPITRGNLHEVLGVLAERLDPRSAPESATKILGFIRENAGLSQRDRWLAESTADLLMTLLGRVESDEAKKIAGQVYRLWQDASAEKEEVLAEALVRHTELLTREELDLMFERTLRRLGAAGDRTGARRATAVLVRWIEGAPGVTARQRSRQFLATIRHHGQRAQLLDLVAQLGPQLEPDQARIALEMVENRPAEGPFFPFFDASEASATLRSCGMASPFVRKDTLARGVALLAWPTCVGDVQDGLIRAIDELVPGHEFGSLDKDGEYHGDLWKLAAWAEAEGYDLRQPPRRPGL